MAEADPRIETDEAEGAVLQPVPPPKPKRNWGRLMLMLSLPIALIIGGVVYWRSIQGQVSTDNAYVHLDKVSVSSEVGGKIVEIFVKDDQHVKAGDLLYRIDPEQFQLQLAQADAAIASAEASQTALAGSSALSGADIAAAQEQIGYARSNLSRQEALWKRGFTTKAAYEAAQHQVALAEAELATAVAKRDEAAAKLATGSQVPGVYPQIAAARAQRSVAQMSLRRTEVRAPISGVITQADRLQMGQDVISGLPVLTLVADGTAYIEANFKETDLGEMRVGQLAEVTFDAYPGLKIRAHVGAIGVGTGSEFSVLPAQNATGNWVKVTQRVPVKIVLDERSPRPLIAGLSVKVTVFTDDRKR
jgi:membrane fusion protein (multidrug efflux system)